jgi:hypothetical protein
VPFEGAGAVVLTSGKVVDVVSAICSLFLLVKKTGRDPRSGENANRRSPAGACAR